MSSKPTTDPEELTAAVRAWAEPNYLKHVPQRDENSSFRDLGPSDWALIFDCETLTDLSLRLRVACYQLRHRGALKQVGLFYDEATVADDELELIKEYARTHRYRVMPRNEFIRQVFLRYAHRRRALVVGFNLPFDVSRLAISHGPAKRDRRMRGGFSFTLVDTPTSPHVQVKRAGARAAFIRFTIPTGRSPEARNREQGGSATNHRGYFVDVGVTAGALLGRRYSLGRLCEVLNTEHRKLEVETHGGPITREYLDYLCLDVQVTWECFVSLRDRYHSLGLTQTPLSGIYSEAGIGKGLLRELGLAPWRQLQPNVPSWLLATIMETYYGGRSECAIRKTPVAGSYVDFSSEYPLCFVLMNLWQVLTATGIEWHRENPARVTALLDRLTPDDVLDPEFWKQLLVLVRIRPQGDRLPTRAKYKGHASAPFNVAVPFRSGGPDQWYTLADACASRLMTGKTPKIVDVLAFRASGTRQPDLRPVDFGSDPRYRIDPIHQDVIKRLVELRTLVRTDLKAAKLEGTPADVARLEGTQQAMKATANSTAYGTPIELNVIEHRRPVDVTVHLPDGGSYATKSRRIEEPGRWFHPLIGTLVSGAGRLLLATLMTLVERRGGSYAFCDTDSLFIVNLSQQQVVGIIERFKTLNPYDRELVPGSILKLEDENFDPDTGERRDPICLGLAAKRTAQFELDENGHPRLLGDPTKRRRSEHGLGHLRLPQHPKLGSAPALDEWWEHTISCELDLEQPEPGWFSQEAIGGRAVTSPHDDKAFRPFNSSRDYDDRVRPFNFHNIAHPTPIERSRTGIRCLIAPHETEPARYRSNDWYDRADTDGATYRITTNKLEITDNVVVVQTFRDYFNDHRRHTDAKLLDPGDGKPCHPWTRGPLVARHITASRLVRIGKESTTLADDGLSGTDAQAFEYAERSCPGCGAPVDGRRTWCGDACRKRVHRQRLR